MGILTRSKAAGAGGNPWEVKISDGSTIITAAANDRYLVDTTNSAMTIKLPLTAAVGDTVRFIDLAGQFATNNLTVGKNGHNIQGVNQDLIVSTARAGFELAYTNAIQGWLLTDK